MFTDFNCLNGTRSAGDIASGKKLVARGFFNGDVLASSKRFVDLRFAL